MSDELTQEQASEQPVNDLGDRLTREEMQNEFYVRDLIKTYLDRIDGQRQRDVFVSLARGIIQEMMLANNNQPLGRSGDYSYRKAFDVAWEGLFGDNEPNDTKAETSQDKPKEEVTDEPVKKAESTGVPPTPTKRTAGDIQPVQDGEEMESYVEKLGLANYAKARNKLHKMTKTLKTTHASESGLNEIMKELDADG